MKANIYKFVSRTKKALLLLGIAAVQDHVIAQNTYTFTYTGGQQTIALQPGTYTLETWGAEGGTNFGNGTTTFTQSGGKGGYAVGIYTISSPITLYVNVGGRGANSTSSLNVTVPGGYNGGGYGSANGTSGKTSGAGGGGCSHIATASGTLASLSTNTASVRIVAGGGGGPGESNYLNTNTSYNANGGNGGGLSGLQIVSTGYQGRHGQGGTQTAGGGGGDNGSAIAGVPLQGIFGAGGYNTATGVNTSVGGSGAGGGGGGWYGGGSGWVATGTAYNAGAGGGGSSYIGGVQNGTTAAFGTTGYVANPDVSGNGYVLIKELCSISIFVTGTTNTLNPAICSGQSLTLTTNAVSNYSWSTGATTSSIVVAPTTNTVYSLAGTSSLSCNTTVTKSVSVNATAPVLSITNPSTSICLGQTTTLTASGALTYTWANAGVINGQPFTPAATAQYTVSGTNGCGTTTTVTSISVAPLPVTASASSTLVCEGTTATLTASSAVTGYTWQPTAQTSSVAIIAPTANTIYTVTASDGICSGTQTVLVTTKTTPTITAVISNSDICAGDMVTLTAGGAGTGGTYSWTAIGGAAGSFTTAPTASTVFVVNGTNSLNCTSSGQTIVVVKPVPVLNIVASKTMVCSGQTISLTVSGGTNYAWSGGPSTALYTIAPTAASTIYSVTGTHSVNLICTATKTIAITVFIPSITVSPSMAICYGQSATLTASGANTYTWNGIPGTSGQQVFTPLVSTTYTLGATSQSIATICLSTRSTQVVVNAQPTITAAATKTNAVCKNQTNTLTITGASSYTWQGTLGTSTSVVVSPTITTTHSVIGENQYGCTDTAFVTAKVTGCNGISEMTAASKITVYPNPSNGKFMLSAESTETVHIISALGQLVRVIELSATNGYAVEVNDLAKGIYYLCTASDATAYTKLIVN